MDVDIRALPFPINVVSVRTLDDYRLVLDFEIGKAKTRSRGVFDMAPYLDKGSFGVLRDPRVFHDAHIVYGAVTWPGDIDLAPERMYTDCEPIP